MRSRLSLFALVGLAATGVDVALLAVLKSVIWLLPADLVALTAASFTSYFGNRLITFRGHKRARWVRRPSFFAAVGVGAAMVDVAVLVGLSELGVQLAVAKTAAVGLAAMVRWSGYRRILFAQVRRELEQQRERSEAPGELRLTVVIPAYNEGELIAATVDEIFSELDKSMDRSSYEVLVVDDGSPDETAEIAARAGARVLAQPVNAGKGAAVRAGVLASEGRSVVFTDADLAYPPSLLVEIMETIEAGWDIVVGSRRHTDTNTLVKARRIRELGGRAINLFTHMVLLGAFHDTQCGIKGFRSDVGKAVFERTRLNGFAFDIEVFLIAEQGRVSLTEIPVSVSNRPGSSVSLIADSIKLFTDLAKLRYWVGIGRYRPTPQQKEVLEARAKV